MTTDAGVDDADMALAADHLRCRYCRKIIHARLYSGYPDEGSFHPYPEDECLARQVMES